ncbi:MAG: hypothetical protein KDA79_23325, partial [Planctomycetaceae bacterium]|nr:hypothetical protein [Planctomycetaceae bacterium]
AAMLPIGAYEPEWFMGHNHLNPEQAGAAFLALGAKHLLPMHWGTFQLTDEPLREPAQRLRAWRKSQTETIAEGQAPAPPGQPRLHIPSIGQTVELK